MRPLEPLTKVLGKILERVRPPADSDDDQRDRWDDEGGSLDQDRGDRRG